MDKRTFLKASGIGVTALSALSFGHLAAANTNKSSAKSGLTNIVGDIKPITVEERRKRIAKAQLIMQKQNIAAIVIEPGASMDYFAGIQWWRSERLTALIIPREGEIAVVTPFFEEPSVRETLAVGDDVRVWQEHENPFALVKQILDDRKIKQGKIGFESTVRYFVLKGVMKVLGNFHHTSAEPVVLGCRLIKSAHELQLMHKANEITLKAYEHVWQQLEKGMDQQQVKSLMSEAQQQLGGAGVWNMALFNEASAYPHGTRQTQIIKDGSIVLMDCGCNVHGYQSDISRTFVYGEPSVKQKQVWNLVRQGQMLAFETATVGTPAGKIDDTVRSMYESKGYGPDYKLPGLSHRLGHGIGMEGHEKINFVRNETTPLTKGMCMSNEPGIYIPGEFGVRLEDCLYIGEEKAHWFTSPPESLDKPIGKLVPLV
ncbi:M24 family metallopeptidase [Alteromonas sp. ASW11-130]|uniref:M24 family metallopeptidase n=1 Tax=Alteromonas sp. ASW11-130 TaxID=3015775 RepID=UPI002241E386|nr:Xaa-Pro peptidase family protein [Alteromonas sp. ASW11-130]MCW8091577.1 Xaa-Pro peptidase family protein [Alteromonas sp. ASW11-130]